MLYMIGEMKYENGLLLINCEIGNYFYYYKKFIKLKNNFLLNLQLVYVIKIIFYI